MTGKKNRAGKDYFSKRFEFGKEIRRKLIDGQVEKGLGPHSFIDDTVLLWAVSDFARATLHLVIYARV
jgi:hypothetical protein